MTKEKMISLQSYLDQMTNKLTSVLPKKHLHREPQYRAFLRNEIRMVKSKIEAARLEGVVK